MNNSSLNNPFQSSDLQIDWSAGVSVSAGWIAPQSGIIYFSTFQVGAGQGDATGYIGGGEVYLSACATNHFQGSIAIICKGNTLTGNASGKYYPFK